MPMYCYPCDHFASQSAVVIPALPTSRAATRYLWSTYASTASKFLQVFLESEISEVEEPLQNSQEAFSSSNTIRLAGEDVLDSIK